MSEMQSEQTLGMTDMLRAMGEAVHAATMHVPDRPHPKQSGHTGTAAVIYKMMTERTGASMLDSGDAYGRAWQRNRKNGFDQAPEAYPFDRDHPEEGYLINTFDFLCRQLEYNPGIQAEFRRFERRTDPDDSKSWLQIMEEYGEERGYRSSTHNTYNDGDRDNLNSVLQFVAFSDDDGEHVLMQYHGGCDVRGGYTAPVAFDVSSWEEFNTAKGEISLSCGCTTRDIYGVYMYDHDGDDAKWPSHWKPDGAEPRCSKCGNTVTGDMRC